MEPKEARGDRAEQSGRTALPRLPRGPRDACSPAGGGLPPRDSSSSTAGPAAFPCRKTQAHRPESQVGTLHAHRNAREAFW